MTGIDSFYTPTPLADRLISYIGKRPIRNVIDFCVGDGELLKSVLKHRKNLKAYGTDISVEAIRKLAIDKPNFILGCCDFRNDESIASVSFLKNTSFDLILLNPPFTCKGSIVEIVEFEGKQFKVSTAMLFLLRSLRYLSENGGVYAIVPISVVYSEKDKKAWEYLKMNYNAIVLEESSRVYFADKCSPNIAFVYVGKYRKKGMPNIRIDMFSKLPVTDVVRGQVRTNNVIYCNNETSIPFIHTTNIQHGKLVDVKRVFVNSSAFEGFGVVIPRVCNPKTPKVSVLDGNSSYVLSDCIIVLKTASVNDAIMVRDFIENYWELFKDIYKGTGAQYTTLIRVKQLLGIGEKS